MEVNKDLYAKTRASLVKHEGNRTFPYTDTVGKITIGIGYNLTDRGIAEEWVNQQFESDLSYFYNALIKFDWFIKLNDDRQVVLLDMSFMGIKRLLEFEGMISAIEKGDYELAAQEMLNSEWAKEVKQRATDLAEGMRTGEYVV